MYIYPAIVHEEDGFWIEFPDLIGCQTSGDTLEETLTLAQEALGLYLVSLIENKEPIPKPSKLSEIKIDSGQTSYITVDIDNYRRNTKAVKKMVSLPEWLADEAEANDISLSRTLQEAIKTRLNIL